MRTKPCAPARRQLFQACAVTVAIFLTTATAYGQPDDIRLRVAQRPLWEAGRTKASVVPRFDTEETVTGWTFSLCHDPIEATLIDVVPGPVFDDLNPDFYSINLLASGFTAEVVLGVDDIVAGPFLTVHVAEYEPLVAVGETIALDFCDDLTNPPVLPRVTVGGVEVIPEIDPGQLLVVDPEFLVQAPTLEIGYVEGATPAPFSAFTTIAQLSSGPVLPTQGFAISVTHDPQILEAVLVRPAGPVVEVQGGVGPEFFGVSLEEGGWAVGVVYSFAGVFVHFDVCAEATETVYQVQPGVGVGGAFSALTISDGIGDPPVQTTVVVTGTSRFVEAGHGSVTLLPITFLRGDANDDGVADIADGVTILAYLFSGGATPGCLAATDINVDRSIDIGDPVRLFNYILLGGPPPAEPFPDCGTEDATFGCVQFDSCP